MQARREFLETGHYAKLSETLAKVAMDSVPGSDSITLLDMGCGEGYYTDGIRKALPEAAQVYGLDISKVAVRYASKRYPECDFSVASSYRLPFADNSLDVIVKVYAPSSEDELLRCLKPGGVLISVTPGERHLYQLRERIYYNVRPHQDEAEKFSKLSLLTQTPLHYEMTLEKGVGLRLLQMTPFAWKATDELRNDLSERKLFLCEAHFTITRYENAHSK
ncbi:ribosomal RNA large subunit methyltransferase A [Vibrio ishigakensis]|uniref:Ribosomal RNA large subunit methyltransferase A n=1 Tax=Vibrio ishigakensis TaxID=1481914 RepID=A0A0B8Q1Y2_9VIBR|nr:ribosomal RNA large subunit methyltransferase A [Vibrio ishigakensis]